MQIMCMLCSFLLKLSEPKKAVPSFNNFSRGGVKMSH